MYTFVIIFTCCRTVASTSTDGESSSLTCVSSVDASVSRESNRSPLSTLDNHPVTMHCPVASDGLSTDGLQVIANSQTLIDAVSGEPGDSVLTLHSSQIATTEVPSHYAAGDSLTSQAGNEQHCNTYQSAATEYNSVRSNDVCSDDDDDNYVPIISASSSLSSFTITPCSSVTVNDTTIDSSPYPVAVSSFELAPHTSSDSVMSTLNTFPAEHHRPMDDSLANAVKAADMSAASCTVTALNLPLSATQSTSVPVQRRRRSAPEVVSDGRNSSEAIWPREQTDRSNCNVEFLSNTEDAYAVGNGRQLYECTEDHSVNDITSPPHLLSAGFIAPDFNRPPSSTSGSVFASRDNTRQLHGSIDIENNSFESISVSAIAADTNRTFSPKFSISEATVVNETRSSDWNDGKTHPVDHTSPTVHSSAAGVVANASVKKPSKPAIDQHSVNDVDSVAVSKCRATQISDETVDTNQLNATDGFTAVKQVSLTCCFF